MSPSINAATAPSYHSLEVSLTLGPAKKRIFLVQLSKDVRRKSGPNLEHLPRAVSDLLASDRMCALLARSGIERALINSGTDTGTETSGFEVSLSVSRKRTSRTDSFLHHQDSTSVSSVHAEFYGQEQQFLIMQP